MSIPVPIPVGALPITDSDTAKAEALVAAVVQVIKNGTSGGTPIIGTPATIVPDSFVNPVIDPLTGLPKVSSVVLDTPQSQLFYRQFAIAMAKIVPGWSTGSGPSLGDLVFNEVPVGTINGVNKSFSTAYKFIASSTSFYYNGQRLLLGTDYTETVPRTGITISSLFPAPKVGDNLVIDYVKDNT